MLIVDFWQKKLAFWNPPPKKFHNRAFQTWFWANFCVHFLKNWTPQKDIFLNQLTLFKVWSCFGMSWILCSTKYHGSLVNFPSHGNGFCPKNSWFAFSRRNSRVSCFPHHSGHFIGTGTFTWTWNCAQGIKGKHSLESGINYFPEDMSLLLIVFWIISILKKDTPFQFAKGHPR